MAKELVLQTAFSAGELSPHLHDRIDLDAYYAGCAEIENFIPLPHGPLLRRRGTHFIYAAPSASIRLIPFTFNITQTFVLELTPGKMRVFYKDGILLNSAGTVLEVATPWTAATLSKIQWAQHGDWLYVVNGTDAPRAIKRYSNTNWAVETLTFTKQPVQWVAGNYPSQVVLFEQRAFYAATPAQPQQIWASRTGLYEDFTTVSSDGVTVLDDHGFTYTVFSNDANGIEWMLASSSLVIGTAGAEFRLGSTSLLDPLTPKNVNVEVQTRYGSAPIRPVTVGTDIIFTQRSRNRIRAFEYSFSEDQYTAKDLTLYASHILEDRVKEMHMQSAPDSYIFFITETGGLVGCTYEKNQKILAWHKHSTNGKFISACILPTTGNDMLYVAVTRETITRDASDNEYITKRTYIEVFIDPWEAISDVNDAFYVDSGLIYNGAPTNTLVGLTHLEGQEVNILVDGWVHPNQVVKNGSVSLQQKGSKIHIGLPYSSSFTSLIPQSKQNITVGFVRRIHEAIIAVEQSLDFYYRAVTEDHLDIAYNGPTKVMNKAVPLTSRHQIINIESKSNRTQQLQIMQDRPVPLIIRGITYSINPSKI